MCQSRLSATIGAADPDSVHLVQRLDSEGAVEKTYIRNPNKPNEVWIIKGEVNDFTKIKRRNIIKKMVIGNFITPMEK